MEKQQRMLNIAREEQLKQVLSRFWGCKNDRHSDLVEDHLEILSKTLLVKPSSLSEDLFRNRLKVGEFSDDLSSILTKTALKRDLSPEYLDLCLKVTSSRPAIGRGEFLFVASFINLSFCEGSGDLIDLDTKSKIEVKGDSAQLGNGDNEKFKKLERGLVPALLDFLGILDKDKPERNLNLGIALKLQDRMKNSAIARKVFLSLQNTSAPDTELAKHISELWAYNRDLMRCVAAMHLLSYSKLENIDYILFLNDERFKMIKAPKKIEDVMRVLDELQIKSWRVNDPGIRISLK